jgi:hypothetical protein
MVCNSLLCRSLQWTPPNRPQDLATPFLPRPKRPEQSDDLLSFVYTPPAHVPGVNYTHLDVFIKQKVDQVGKALERLVVGLLRAYAIEGGGTPYITDRPRNPKKLGSVVDEALGGHRHPRLTVTCLLGKPRVYKWVLYVRQSGKKGLGS